MIEGPVLSPEQNVSLNSVVQSTFEPFIVDGVVALSEAEFEMKHIGILRDTGAAQSFIQQSVLPFSELWFQCAGAKASISQ